jgi:hypothetical protein
MFGDRVLGQTLRPRTAPYRIGPARVARDPVGSLQGLTTRIPPAMNPPPAWQNPSPFPEFSPAAAPPQVAQPLVGPYPWPYPQPPDETLPEEPDFFQP